MSQLNLSTFEAGILQAKAYRNLRSFMQRELEKYDLTMMQWALLGTISAHGSRGITINELAAIIDVEGSLITTMVNTAAKSGHVRKKVHPQDSRARIVVMTAAGARLVERVENDLRGSMRKWMKSIPRLSLITYIQTLSKITNLK